ncbi:hypothetical protein GCM10008909_25270 [Hathewaya limosa]
MLLNRIFLYYLVAFILLRTIGLINKIKGFIYRVPIFQGGILKDTKVSNKVENIIQMSKL